MPKQLNKIKKYGLKLNTCNAVMRERNCSCMTHFGFQPVKQTISCPLETINTSSIKCTNAPSMHGLWKPPTSGNTSAHWCISHLFAVACVYYIAA